jgi:hypothetical protein
VIQAELRGKLSESASLGVAERWEDVLTSSVFGLLAYLPPCLFLSFLRTARNLKGDPAPIAENVATLSLDFWPTPPGWNREPDVVADLISAGGSLLQRVVIEAKYLSGKSQRKEPTEEEEAKEHAETGDQLADEMRLALRDHAQGSVAAHASPVVIYVTGDFAIPADELEESEARLARHRSKGPNHIYWLGWWQLAPLLRSPLGSSAEWVIKRDLGALLKRRGLSLLNDAWERGSFQQGSWTFGPSTWWKRIASPPTPSWSFGSPSSWFQRGFAALRTWGFTHGRL